MSVDLTQLGYPPDLGDGSLFIGVDLLDGDSFDPPSDSYGTRTWWFRQYEGDCCPAWAYLDPTYNISDVAEPAIALMTLGDARPNPFHGSTAIRYLLSQPSASTLEIYDVQGRLIRRDALGVQPAGEHTATFEGSGHPAGIYLYRVTATDPQTGDVRSSSYGHAVLLK
jgi:hypothetical protein